MIPQKLPRGIFWRDNAYWIRYADRVGRMHREKVGPFLKKAMAAYNKRKSEIYEGKFFSPGERQRPIVFSEISKDFLDYSKRNKRSHGHDSARMVLLLRLWRECLVTELNAGRIERDLGQAAMDERWLPATYTRYRALASATFSLAIRNGKALPDDIPPQHKEVIEKQRAWLKSHFDNDIPAALARVPKMSIFVAQGGKDIQIPPGDADRVRTALAAGKNREPLLKGYPELNHVFSASHGGGVTEYADADARVDPAFLADTVDFFTRALTH